MLKSRGLLAKMRNFLRFSARNAFLRALDRPGTLFLCRILSQDSYAVRYEQEQNFELSGARFQVQWDILAQHVAFVHSGSTVGITVHIAGHRMMETTQP